MLADRRQPWTKAPPKSAGRALERQAFDAGFAWVINPYGGCELGCTHCPARLEGVDDAKAWLEGADPAPRTEAMQVLLAHLADVARREDASFAKHPVLLGTACDPWQPAERDAQLTRQLLEALAGIPGVDLRVTTRSSLVGRDVDLLARIAQRGKVRVAVAVPTLERKVWLALEPHGPSPERRLMAVGLLARAGIPVGVEVGPVLRGVGDSNIAWGQLLSRAKAAGAQFAEARPLSLSEGQRERLVKLGGQAEPERARLIEWLYQPAHVHDARTWLYAHERFVNLAQKSSLGAELPPVEQHHPKLSTQDPRQLALF